MKLFLFSLLSLFISTTAFAPSNNFASRAEVTSLSSTEEVVEGSPRNPDKPELPEIKGDFDWDAKFGGDDDWIVDNIPGKMALSEVELAAQSTALGKLEESYRKVRLQEEYDAATIREKCKVSSPSASHFY